MKKTKVTKYRLILSLSDEDVAFEKLFNDLTSIESKFLHNVALINQAKRKHFLKILHAYCNQREWDHASSTVSPFFETVPVHLATAEPPRRPSPSPPPTPVKHATIEEASIPPEGMHQPGGIINFGKFNLEIK